MGACLGSPASQTPAHNRADLALASPDTNRPKQDAEFERTSASKAPNNIGRVSMSSEKAADNKGIARISRQASARSSATNSSPDNVVHKPFDSVAGKGAGAGNATAGKLKPKDDEVWD